MDTKGVKPETPTTKEAAAGAPATYGSPKEKAPGSAPEPERNDRPTKQVIKTEEYGTYVEDLGSGQVVPGTEAEAPVNPGQPAPDVVARQPGETLDEAGERISKQQKEAEKAAKKEDKS